MEHLKFALNLLLFAVIGCVGITIIGAIIFRIGWVTFIDNYEFGYKFDTRTGITEAIVDQEGKYKTGYVVTPPFLVKVHTIDLRPIQVCINANSRVLNCKLVSFNPDGFKQFISWHGRGDYEQINLESILMSYAYDGSENSYTFLTISKELNNNKVKSDTLR